MAATLFRLFGGLLKFLLLGILLSIDVFRVKILKIAWYVRNYVNLVFTAQRKLLWSVNMWLCKIINSTHITIHYPVIIKPGWGYKHYFAQ